MVLYPSEHEALKQAAAEQGVTISEIIRTRVFRNRTTIRKSKR
jgi:predicted Rossmann fold nucleotide-binding protein DprA/Smf involved in DNA uptake